jgi:hypothetical protein
VYKPVSGFEMFVLVCLGFSIALGFFIVFGPFGFLGGVVNGIAGGVVGAVIGWQWIKRRKRRRRVP